MRDDLLSSYAKLSEKLTFATPCYAHIHVSENIAYVRNGWPLTKSMLNRWIKTYFIIERSLKKCFNGNKAPQ